MTLQSLYERKSDVLVLRAFGTGKNALFTLFIIELTSIIVLASVLSYALSHLVSYLLNISIFDFKTFILSTSPLSLYLGVFVCVFVFAWLIARTLVNTPLRKLLAEK